MSKYKLRQSTLDRQDQLADHYYWTQSLNSDRQRFVYELERIQSLIEDHDAHMKEREEFRVKLCESLGIKP